MKKDRARVILEDGSEYLGWTVSGEGTVIAELVFNTALSGYQEILTDPSYAGQMVLMTYPMIGNYGVNTSDMESSKIHLSGFLMKEYSETYSNWRAEESLKSYLSREGIFSAEGFDTRAITRRIRTQGAVRAEITNTDESTASILEKIKAHPSLAGQNLASVKSCKSSYTWDNGNTGTGQYKVGVIDCGLKQNILRILANYGCELTVFPFDVSADILRAAKLDGIMISNGPGDPDAVTETIATIRDLVGEVPIFGICLGHQIIAHALGAKTFKMKFGHHGANHPVQNLATKQVEISSQNHGFCVDADSLPEGLEVSHLNLYDQSVAGIRHKTLPIQSVQYHPEAAPGPHDSMAFFESFIEALEHSRSVAQ